MALTSTLFTGLTGLDVNQTRLNVTGNNIANVNTVAFKSSRTTFKSQFYITDSAGSPSSASFGGTNPSQRGLGATVAAIEKSFDPGAIETTGKATDLAIDGQGFFVIDLNGEQRFTRDGSFTLNERNQLVTNAGAFLQGYAADDNGNVNRGNLGPLTIPLGTASRAQATSSAKFQGNLNANGIPAGPTTASIFDSGNFDAFALGAATPLTGVTTGGGATNPFQVGDVLTLSGNRSNLPLEQQTLTVAAGTTVQDLADFFNRGLQIDTTVAVPATVGAQIVSTGPNSSIQITGNTGGANFLSNISLSATRGGAPVSPTPVQFTRNAASPTTPIGESVNTSVLAYDSLGTPVGIDVTLVYEGPGASVETGETGNNWRIYVRSTDNLNGNPVVGNGVLTFDSDGVLLGSSGTTINIDRTGTGATTPLVIDLDFNLMTSLTSRVSDAQLNSQDGYPIGRLSAFSIGDNGIITGAYSNGLRQTLGQVAIANFANPQGLIDTGGNNYTAGASSGLPIIGEPGALGAGTVRGGSLEGSNVDLSTEFTNLIIATTGFSAASRVITTSDQLITELLNVNR